jgi:hypothetical protein
MSKKLATQHIISCINSITNNDELKVIADALHQQRSWMNAQATRNFIVGDKVKFTGRYGAIVEGVVDRVKIKNLIVKQTNGAQGRWNVTASLCKKVA